MYGNKVDVIFYKGKSPLAWLVRKITKSNFSHVGFLIGLHVIDINYYHSLKVRKLNYKIDEYVTVPLNLSDEQFFKLIEFIRINNGASYDFREIVRYFFKQLSDKKNFYICSEFVYDAIEYCGIKLPGTQDDMVTPQDLYKMLNT